MTPTEAKKIVLEKYPGATLYTVQSQDVHRVWSGTSEQSSPIGEWREAINSAWLSAAEQIMKEKEMKMEGKFEVKP